MTSWDWEKIAGADKVKIIYCFENVSSGDGLPGSTTWKSVVDAAAANWNNAATGWTFEVSNKGTADEGKVSADCQMEVRLSDHNQDGGAFASTDDCKNTGPPTAGKRITKAFLCIDPTPKRNDKKGDTTWNPAGDAFDPEAVLKHEMSHLLRLSHPTNKFDGNLTDPRKPGQHSTDLSATDKQEAKDSVDRTKTPIEKTSTTVPRSGGNCIVPYPLYESGLGGPPASDMVVQFPQGAFSVDTSVDCSPLFEWGVPARFNVPSGTCPVQVALDVGSADLSLDAPATINISYTDDLLGDPEFYGPLGTSGGDLTLQAYYLSGDTLSGHWLPVPTCTVDRNLNIVTFRTTDLTPRYFGIAGSCRVNGVPTLNWLGVVVLVLTLGGSGLFLLLQKRRTARMA